MVGGADTPPPSTDSSEGANSNFDRRGETRGFLKDLVAITLRQKAEKCNRRRGMGGGWPNLPPPIPLDADFTPHLEVIIVTNSS